MDGRRDRAVSHGRDRAGRGTCPRVGDHDKRGEVVKGAAIGGVVGSGGGSLYGLNQNKKHNEAYRAAYAQCMAWHGYGS